MAKSNLYNYFGNFNRPLKVTMSTDVLLLIMRNLRNSEFEVSMTKTIRLNGALNENTLFVKDAKKKKKFITLLIFDQQSMIIPI